MSCNLSLFSGVLIRGAVAFPACTLLIDPVLLRRLRGNGGSGCEAMGGADTGLFGCCSICLCITRIRCLAPWKVLTGDGMTQSVTLMADDGVDGPFEFKHFRGS